MSVKSESISNEDLAWIYLNAKLIKWKWKWNELWYRLIAENIAWIKESLESVFRSWWIEALPFWNDTRNTIALILSMWIEWFCNNLWIKKGEIVDYQLWWMKKYRELVKAYNVDDWIYSENDKY